MDTLEFHFSAQPCEPTQKATLCGVVGSGNLEVLLTRGTRADGCEVRINTSARGFGPIWQAVLADFAAHHALGGTTITINDMGATPAVVTLRLGQAYREYCGDRP